ncbi:MAG: hypothetical protein EBY03_08375, partial [Actinobacteria bacterium]|nr:hypothetical protein [Actinomycetota bacterium]
SPYLASVTTDSGGTTAINGGSVRTTGAQTYGDAVTLGANTTLTGSTITNSSTINGGGYSLTITGNSVINGAISNATSTSISGTTSLGASVTTTTGGQTYTGAVTVSGGDRTLTTSATAAGDTIVFGSTVDSDGATPRALTITTGGATPTIRFNDVVGGTNPLGAIAITGALDLNAAITNASSLTVSGVSDLGANVTTSGNQTYSGDVSLSGGDRTLTGSTVTFNGTVSNVVTLGTTFLNTLNNTYCTSSGPICFNSTLVRSGGPEVEQVFYFTPSSNGIISSIELGINNTGMAVSSAASSLIIDIRQGSTVLSTFIYSSLSGNIVTVTGTQTTLSSGTQYNLNLRGNSGNIGLDRTLTNSTASWIFDNGGNAGATGQYGFPIIRVTGSSPGTSYALNITGNAVFGNATADRVTGLTTLNVSGTTTINTDT